MCNIYLFIYLFIYIFLLFSFEIDAFFLILPSVPTDCPAVFPTEAGEEEEELARTRCPETTLKDFV